MKKTARKPMKVAQLPKDQLEQMAGSGAYVRLGMDMCMQCGAYNYACGHASDGQVYSAAMYYYMVMDGYGC